jgi:hypothetical protein
LFGVMGDGQQDWCVGACTFGVLQMGFCNNDGSAGLLWHLENSERERAQIYHNSSRNTVQELV